MADIITVIAYKSNAVESYRNCVVNQYDSGLEMFSSDKLESVVEFVADIRAKDLDSYNSFDFTFLINGRCIHYDSNYVSEDIPDDLDYDIITVNDETIRKIIQDAGTRVADIYAKRERANEEAARKKKIQEERSKENREREQLAILQQKYGA
jgi:hypothetical protein